MFNIILNEKTISKDQTISFLTQYGEGEQKILPKKVIAYLCGYQFNTVSLSKDDVDNVIQKITKLRQKGNDNGLLVLTSNEYQKLGKGETAFIKTDILTEESLTLHRKTKKAIKKKKEANLEDLISLTASHLSKHQYAREFNNFVPDFFLLSVLDPLIKELSMLSEQFKNADKLYTLVFNIQQKMDFAKQQILNENIEIKELAEAYVDLFAYLLKFETVYKFEIIKNKINIQNENINNEIEDTLSKINLSSNLFSLFIEDALTFYAGLDKGIPTDLGSFYDELLDSFAISTINAAKIFGTPLTGKDT